MRRLTLTYGVRFEYFNGYVPPQHVAATPNGWVPERSFDEVKNVPLWKDVDPRVGAAYDLFGNGRTAAEGGARPVRRRRRRSESRRTTIRSRPRSTPSTAPGTTASTRWAIRAAATTSRTATSPTAASTASAAAMANQNFGGLNATTRYADDALLGYGARSYNWDFTTEVQHELRPGVSMTAGYYRNWFGNHLVTDNTLVTPADFNPFCITAPQRFAPARRRRLSGLRPVRRHAGEVRSGQQRDSAVRQLRRADSGSTTSSTSR